MTANESPHVQTPTTVSQAGYVRLYISPFGPDVLPLAVPKAALPQVQNLSYHSIETFPEKRYGFIDLPVAEADKLRKKLHGAVLKGHKLRVEPASKDDMPRPAGDAALADATAAKKEKKTRSGEGSQKKRKRDRDEIPGVELDAGRKVKRGWTVPDDAKARKDKAKKDKKNKKDKGARSEAKSKFTDGPECLVKTILPANVASSAAVEPGKEKKKRGKDKSRQVVVHEFENSRKFPTFLKTTSGAAKVSGSVEFVDSKGWVDGDGNVVESVTTRSTVETRSRQMSDATSREDPDSTSSSGSSSSSSDEGSLDPDQDDGPDLESEPEGTADGTNVVRTIAVPRFAEADVDTSKLDSPRPKSSGSSRSLTIKIPPVTPAPGKLHPLEALYKRPNRDGGSAPSVSEARPFSFGLGSDDMEDEDDTAQRRGSQPPMTPFTRQDFEQRNTRSAAPTPDTAHPSRSFKFWGDGEEEDIAEESEEDEAADSKADDAAAAEDGDEATASQPGTDDFQKWFWENRGGLNRSWKKRRKVAAKEKRYRENRSKTERAA